MAYVNNKALYYQQFLRRENGTRHHKYDEELQMYNMIRDGNMDAVKVAKNLFLSELSGHLSDTPLKNYKYLFIASITLATRFSIEGAWMRKMPIPPATFTSNGSIPVRM